MSNSVTVFTKPACRQCNSTKSWLEWNGITFVTREIDDIAMELAQAWGIKSAPIVAYREKESGEVYAFGGYNEDELEKLAHTAL